MCEEYILELTEREGVGQLCRCRQYCCTSRKWSALFGEFVTVAMQCLPKNENLKKYLEVDFKQNVNHYRYTGQAWSINKNIKTHFRQFIQVNWK